MVIYKVTNFINGKYYIGKDSKNYRGYLGSGLAIRKAIEKYGKDNFKKEILCYCKDLEDLNKKEIEYVNEEVVNDPNSYNLVLGGQGGDYSKFNKKLHYRSGKTWEDIFGKEKADELKRLHSEKLSGKNNPMFGSHKTAGEKNGMFGRRGNKHPLFGKPCSDEHKENLRKSLAGKKLSDETRKKMSESWKNRNLSYEVHQIDLNGNLIQKFYTIKEAIDILGISKKKAYYNPVFENFILKKVMKEEKRTWENEKGDVTIPEGCKKTPKAPVEKTTKLGKDEKKK